ncbi:conidial pigment biosynthesis oxidase Arb2 [Kalaharituber pfeilii]|nr:conidial pigment biosynthesis oxidase Arb2 [Kalaharituber pfeilii]
MRSQTNSRSFSALPFALILLLWSPLATARLVRHKFVITWEVGAPNGNAREMIKINREFPGPNLWLNQYDDVEITVHNEMPFNTTIHWHGIEQAGTPWSDGVPGLTQRPIEPGQTYIYKWNANTYGTYWYHAHSRGTLQDGLYGAIYIRPHRDEQRPYHLISSDKYEQRWIKRAAEEKPNLLLVSDWTNFTSWDYMRVQRESGLTIFCVDSILANGRGQVFCPKHAELIEMTPPLYLLAFEGKVLTDKGCLPNVYAVQGPFPYDESLIPDGLNSGCIPTNGSHLTITVNPANKWASINFIAGTALKTLRLSIDEHPMWIYEVDGHFIEPQLADTFTAFNGERYSALIKLDKTPGEYTIRLSDTNLDQIISGFATLRYKNSTPESLGRKSVASIDYGGRNTSAEVRELDRGLLLPYPPLPPLPPASAFYTFNFGRLGGSWKWSLDGTALYPSDYSSYEPFLYNLTHALHLMNKQPAPNNPTMRNLIIPTKNNTWVDLLFQVGSNPVQPNQFPHSVHKHSNKMYLIGRGSGIFHKKYKSLEDAMEKDPGNFRLNRPQMRDTFLTTDQGPNWMLVRYHVRIPGPFLLHCHIETHLEGGMAVALLDGVDVWPEVPDEWRHGGVVAVKGREGKGAEGKGESN